MLAVKNYPTFQASFFTKHACTEKRLRSPDMKNILLLLFCFLTSVLSVRAQVYQQPQLLWIDTASAQPKDSYVAFRQTFNMDEDTEAQLRLCGAGWYTVWVNGVFVTEGPDRFSVKKPEYTSDAVRLKKGKNCIAIQVHNEGVTTRLLKNMNPFLFCKLIADGKEVNGSWKCLLLDAYTPAVGRINPQLAWVEWCDTRKLPLNWQQTGFDDNSWKNPVAVDRSIHQLWPVDLASVKQVKLKPQVIASGTLIENYGYERDNISARFYLRSLHDSTLPPQGVWRRYDLGRVRLGRPWFVLKLPRGAVVEFAASEYLQEARVLPWINLSDGDSHNMDHYVARGGEQEFFPLTPKGGRFLEVHVLAPPSSVQFISEQFLERTYHDKVQGSFKTDDSLLNRIWATGIETYRACTEDAVIDNPTRERGQWTGDVTTVGMMIANAGFTDLRLIKRGLIQSALCAREDGMVAGLCPGGEAYLSSYAMQWLSGCMNYYRLTGDRDLLDTLYPFALRNLESFEKFRTPEGISNKAGWAFIDWGYITKDQNADLALNLHYALALRDWLSWCDVLGRKTGRQKAALLYQQARETLLQRINAVRTDAGYDFKRLGYHSVVLSAMLQLFDEKSRQDWTSFLKTHILNCFPNNPSAPRLSDPGANNEQIITPYFSFYAFPLLIENGQMDFVLDQYKKCWGWALQDGRTTWLEVFDPRWSHSHQWSGSPTWQLTKYVLGLSPVFDQRKMLYELSFVDTRLPFARGRIPINGTDETMEVNWERKGNEILYTVHAPVPVWLKTKLSGKETIRKISGTYRFTFRAGKTTL